MAQASMQENKKQGFVSVPYIQGIDEEFRKTLRKPKSK